MDELLFEKFKENEERVKKFGPHLSGIVNCVCNLGLYPFFQVSTQMQLSPACKANYSGKGLTEKLSSFIFTPHPANKPFTAPRFSNYLSVSFYNALQGPTGAYKGYTSGMSFFYLSILSRSLLTSAFYPQLKELSFESKILAGKLLFRGRHVRYRRNRPPAFICSPDKAD